MAPELKKIGNKLFLGTQKVELALIDDINSSLQKAFDSTDVDSIVLNAISKLEKSIPLLKETIKLSDDALQKVKDLGVGGGADKVFSNKKSEAESLFINYIILFLHFPNNKFLLNLNYKVNPLFHLLLLMHNLLLFFHLLLL
jgi:hypothetical protein